MRVKFEVSGDFTKTERFLNRMKRREYLNVLDEFGREGVQALRNATPVDSGATAEAWDYEIKRTRDYTEIVWTNSNINDGVPIAVILQYGHGTGTGGYVQGRDYINPAIRPIFDKIAEKAWKVVTSA
ncbi:hypothetical protein [uncultured Bifidobacterium sp.]|uniref:hypothetical protein n=1 Tax=uncultured Bifidobacterium sp. TaxID=165187 RepID=UPI002592151B|nr:hypothetical protein [uncultured Bifidobacterium sp.]